MRFTRAQEWKETESSGRDIVADAEAPAIAVAAGSYLYIYKNLKPFYKFAVPTIEVNQTELDAWVQVKEDAIAIRPTP